MFPVKSKPVWTLINAEALKEKLHLLVAAAGLCWSLWAAAAAALMVRRGFLRKSEPTEKRLQWRENRKNDIHWSNLKSVTWKPQTCQSETLKLTLKTLLNKQPDSKKLWHVSWTQSKTRGLFWLIQHDDEFNSGQIEPASSRVVKTHSDQKCKLGVKLSLAHRPEPELHSSPASYTRHMYPDIWPLPPPRVRLLQSAGFFNVLEFSTHVVFVTFQLPPISAASIQHTHTHTLCECVFMCLWGPRHLWDSKCGFSVKVTIGYWCRCRVKVRESIMSTTCPHKIWIQTTSVCVSPSIL